MSDEDEEDGEFWVIGIWLEEDGQPYESQIGEVSLTPNDEGKILMPDELEIDGIVYKAQK